MQLQYASLGGKYLPYLSPLSKARKHSSPSIASKGRLWLQLRRGYQSWWNCIPTLLTHRTPMDSTDIPILMGEVDSEILHWWRAPKPLRWAQVQTKRKTLELFLSYKYTHLSSQDTLLTCRSEPSSLRSVENKRIIQHRHSHLPVGEWCSQCWYPRTPVALFFRREKRK